MYLFFNFDTSQLRVFTLSKRQAYFVIDFRKGWNLKLILSFNLLKIKLKLKSEKDLYT